LVIVDTLLYIVLGNYFFWFSACGIVLTAADVAVTVLVIILLGYCDVSKQQRHVLPIPSSILPPEMPDPYGSVCAVESINLMDKYMQIVY